MIKAFSDLAWEDYCYLEEKDKPSHKRIKKLIKDIDRNEYEGIGSPEPLKGDYSGYWSRRINEKDRIIYKIEENTIKIIQCRTHYGDR